MARRRGWQRQHITAIVAVNAQGQATKPALLWNTKQIRGDMFLCAQCPVTLKGMPDGWSFQEVFLEWVETVLVKETQPLSNPQKCILLLVDGSKTHLTLQGLDKMKSWGVEVVVFPLLWLRTAAAICALLRCAVDKLFLTETSCSSLRRGRNWPSASRLRCIKQWPTALEAMAWRSAAISPSSSACVHTASSATTSGMSTSCSPKSSSTT